MKKFITKKVLEHLTESSLLYANVDTTISAKINDICIEILASNTQQPKPDSGVDVVDVVDKEATEDKLKSLLNDN